VYSIDDTVCLSACLCVVRLFKNLYSFSFSLTVTKLGYQVLPVIFVPICKKRGTDSQNLAFKILREFS